jgi:hypothetical protein
MAQDSCLDVADVSGPRREVRAGQLFQPRDKLFEHIDDCMFCGGLLFFDDLTGVRAQGRVGDHPTVRRQNVGILRS